MSKAIGDLGEDLAASLLSARGFAVNKLGTNYPTLDLKVESAQDRFGVSVKLSASKPHVRLGRPQAIAGLRDGDFVFAFLPKAGRVLEPNADWWDLLILPAPMVRKDAIWVHETYLSERSVERARSGSAGVMVKGYSRRPAQQEVWSRWCSYQDRWDLLPPAR